MFKFKLYNRARLVKTERKCGNGSTQNRATTRTSFPSITPTSSFNTILLLRLFFQTYTFTRLNLQQNSILPFPPRIRKCVKAGVQLKKKIKVYFNYYFYLSFNYRRNGRSWTIFMAFLEKLSEKIVININQLIYNYFNIQGTFCFNYKIF